MSHLTGPRDSGAPEAAGGTRRRGPWFALEPPACSSRLIPRPRLRERLDDATSASRLTLVCAPGGYGKTVAAADWTRHTGLATAWLGLTPQESDPHRLLLGILTTLSRAQPSVVRAPEWDAGDFRRPQVDLDTVLRAAHGFVDPLVLVVDDAHLAGDAIRSTLAPLVELGPPALRLVLTGRPRLRRLMARTLVHEPSVEIGTDQLALTVEEVAQVLRITSPASRERAELLHQQSGGWPVAVRLFAAADAQTAPKLAGLGPAGASGLLTDYVRDEVLDALGGELTDFVLAVTSPDRVDARLAQVLTARPDSSALLEECVARGLPLTVDTVGGDRDYRWHAVFARACRAILRQQDSARADLLERRLATWYADSEPLLAVEHALRAADHDLAVSIIGQHWPLLVVGNEIESLERVCAGLPTAWADSALVLFVRAACLELMGEHSAARRMLDHAEARAVQTAPARNASEARAGEVARQLARLFVHDAYSDRRDACDELRRQLTSWPEIAPATYGCVTLVLGWAELRLRRSPGLTIETLRTAARACTSTGQEETAHRAKVNLAFACSFAGRFEEADQVLDELADRAPASPLLRVDAGIEDFTRGYSAYWRDDLDSAFARLDSVVRRQRGYTMFGTISRAFLALAASASGDADRLEIAEAALAQMVDHELHGLPWDAYRAVALAHVHEARGQTSSAVRVARGVRQDAHLPAMMALVAEVMRRHGELEEAARFAAKVPRVGIPHYVQVSLSTTRAVLLAAHGSPERAHAVLERTLAEVNRSGARRPLSAGDPSVRALLEQHAAWATRHEALVVSLLNARTPGTRGSVPERLSPREQELLNYLRTSMPLVEIAAAMTLSINTVKTHQRSLYRKLGAGSRREAVSHPG